MLLRGVLSGAGRREMEPIVTGGPVPVTRDELLPPSGHIPVGREMDQ